MEEKYKQLLYTRGFLVTNKKQERLSELNWIHQIEDNLNIYFHPQTTFSFYKKSDDWVCLIGHVVDTINNTVNIEEISKYLFTAHQASTDKFFDYVERLSGRYAIITSFNKQMHVYNDATGMKSIFYHKHSPTFGTHAKLVADAANEGKSTEVNEKWMRERKTYHYPGDFTPHNNVYFLLPNHSLTVGSQKVARYFPRELLSAKDPNKAINVLIEETAKQLELITEKNKILMSLTAGFDSRSTLALLKKHTNSALFFTYYYMHSEKADFKTSKSLDLDKDIVSDMVDNLQLNHEMVPIDYAESRTEDYTMLREILRENTFLNHNALLARLYLKNYSGENYLHLRSNIQEISRLFYKKQYKFKGNHASLEDVVMCTNPALLADENAVQLYEQWLERYNPNIGMNYDPFDLLYWESRMGTWHSQLIIQSDIAFDTHILMNSQYILKNLLAIPEKIRSTNGHLHLLIQKRWPVLSFWNYNKQGNLTHVINEQKKLLAEQKKVQIVSKTNVGLKKYTISYTAGNVFNKTTVPCKVMKYDDSEEFHLDKSAPQLGDFVRADIPLLTKNLTKDYIAFIELCSPYQNEKYVGRLKYQVFLNNELLLEEDIASWEKTNQIIIPLQRSEMHKLSIQVQAFRDCEAWNWGRAARIQLKNIDIVENTKSLTGKVLSSSPYSVIHSQEDEGINGKAKKRFGISFKRGIK